MNEQMAEKKSSQNDNDWERKAERERARDEEIWKLEFMFQLQYHLLN